VLINQLTFSQSLYLRAHRRDPFLVPSMLGAVLTALVLVQAARHLRFPSFVATYALLSVPGLLISTWVFRGAGWSSAPPAPDRRPAPAAGGAAPRPRRGVLCAGAPDG
jgi:hypothetical protein